MTWRRTIGRVEFVNCEPLFYNIDPSWKVLPAPPAWLTGHLLRKDCILAPIPAADYARHHKELVLVPDIAISSKGEVGSVLLLGTMKLSEMKSIALPTDSATSVALLKFLLKTHKLSPKLVEMGPDLKMMLSECDGCLLIGDRALEAAHSHPELEMLDLGSQWRELSGLPMVFGVFATRRDSNIEDVKEAHRELLLRLNIFENDPIIRQKVLELSAKKSNQSLDRMDKYFGEVINRMDNEDLQGLTAFLRMGCGLATEAEFAW
jgi:chorismate dehydratase